MPTINLFRFVPHFIQAAFVHWLLLGFALGDTNTEPPPDYELGKLLEEIDPAKPETIPMDRIPTYIAKLRSNIPKEWANDEGKLFYILAYKLVQFGDKVPPETREAAIDVLISKMESRTDGSPNWQISCVAGIEDPRLIATVEKLGQSPDPEVRQAVARFFANRARRAIGVKDGKTIYRSPFDDPLHQPDGSPIVLVKPDGSEVVLTDPSQLSMTNSTNPNVVATPVTKPSSAESPTPSSGFLWTCAAAAVALLVSLVVFWKRRPS